MRIALRAALGAIVLVGYGATPTGCPSLAWADQAPPNVEHQGKPLGIKCAPVPPGSAEVLKLHGDHGLIIVEITKGGVADHAGLLKGDVLLTVDERPVYSQAALSAALDAAAPSHRAVVEVSRQGVIQSFTLEF